MRMCATVVLVSVGVLAGVEAGAAAGRPGVRILVGTANIEGSDNAGLDEMGLGYGVGVATIVPVAPGIGLETGLSYVRKGGQGSISYMGIDFDTEMTIEYVEIPVLLRVAQGSAFVSVGLTLDFLGSAETTASGMGSSTTNDASDQLTDLDICFAVGGGTTINTPAGTTSVGVLYTRSLATIDDAGDFDVYNQAISLFVGVQF
jgi:hypothetical protein